MQSPVEITFRRMAHAAALKAWIRKEAEKLERYDDRIVRCHVVIEPAHKHHRKGNLYDVRIA